MAGKTEDLENILNQLDGAARKNGAKVSVGELVETFGRRSFGPLLLLAGLLGMTPVSGVPTVPTIIAVLVVLIAGQLLFGRDSIWIPRFIQKLAVKADGLHKAVRAARKPTRTVDRIVKPRLQALTTPTADRVVALACVLVAVCVPPLELLPFVAFVPSLAIFTFGLALVARDGLLVLIALLISGSVLGLIAWQLLR